MAKRSRGSSRPGQRRPAQRPVARPAARPALSSPVVPADSLSEAEEARAAELEARLVAEERAASDARSRDRQRARAADLAPRVSAGGRVQSSVLAARAAEEYTYVQRDVRRIATVGGSMVGILVALFLLIEVVHVLSV